MADPTVTDVFNQLVLVNGKLAQVEVNTSLMANLNMSINTGFAATVGRLDTLAAINVEAVKLLFHQTRQMDTMICMLEQISQNTCSMLNELTVQTKLQTSMAKDVSVVRHIDEASNPGAALELARHQELTAKIEQCCPPTRPEPACKHDPCQRPGPADTPKLPQIPSQPPRPPG
ncbi:MAG: hypothetical protein E6Q92_01225 [Burkholderiaceae bacterium]|nr:MAG: hypothetical protein E6Q92_01225 [Burkholderiaceae bacterium]